MAWIDDYQVWLTEEQSLSNAQLVANHFKGTDWTQEAISALLGNMRHESSINPNMYEYGYEWEEDRGFGLVQWTPRSKYWEWAVARSLPPREGNSQLARINYEVDNNIQWIANGHALRYGLSDKYDFSFADFRTNAQGLTVEALTEAFMWNYEGPAYEAGIGSLPGRQQFAGVALSTLDWSGSGTSYPKLPVNAGTPITDRYGQRIDPISGEQSFHAGLDYAGGTNDPIYATMSGTVMVAEYNTGGLGNVIWIKHADDKYYSAYAHLETFNVTAGEKVVKGQKIGGMGTTGYSTGVHLHFVIATVLWGNNASNTIDPEVYLATATEGGEGDTPTPSRPVVADTKTPLNKHEKGYEKEMIYTVKPGDTLSEIAKKYNVAMKDILGVHHLDDWNKLDVGQLLLVTDTKKPERKYHTVKSGDNLWKIGGQYGISVSRLINLNIQLKNPDLIQVGDKIWLE